MSSHSTSGSKAIRVSIADLPPDVLIDILWFSYEPCFAYVDSIQSIKSLGYIAPRPYLGVCRRWKGTALSARKLWAHWQIHLNVRDNRYLGVCSGHGEMFSAVDRFIEDSIAKSGDATMYFHLEVIMPVSREETSLKSLAALVDRLNSCQKRWGHVSIDVPSRKIEHLGTSFSTAQFHRLRNLDLTGYWNIEKWNLKGTLPILADPILIPTLRSLSLTGTSLKICKLWLSKCPNLKTFRVGMDSKEDVDVGHLFLERLEAMELTCSLSESQRYLAFGSLFDSITCPGLQRLGASGAYVRRVMDDEFLRPMERLMERGQRRLSGLFLHRFQSRSLPRSWATFSNISELHVCYDLHESYPSPSIFRALTNDVCPMLCVVSIGRTTAPNEDYIDFLTSRWNAEPRMLRSVHFLACQSRVASEGCDDVIYNLHRGLPPNWGPIKVCIEEGLHLDLEPFVDCRSVIHT